MELPILRTERLRLGPVRLFDARRVAELAGHREVARNTESIPHPYPEEEAVEWIERLREEEAAGEAAVFAARLPGKPGQQGREDDDRPGVETPELVGAVGLHPEPDHDRATLGYWIGKPHWGNGYATEAAREVVRWGFEELEIGRIYARSFSHNRASCRLLEKLGMEREGVLRRHFRKWEEFVDVEVYGLLRSER